MSTKELLLLPMVLARATGSRATLLDLLSFHSLVTDQVEFGEGAAARLLSGEELDTDVVGFPKLWDAAKKALTDSTQRIRLITRHYPEAGRLGPRGAEALAQLEQVAGGEAEQKAARRLGLSATEMAAVALGLWGRGLTEERDDRTAALLEPGASTRTQQAVRGRVTRGLLAEVSDYLASIVAEGQDDGAGD